MKRRILAWILLAGFVLLLVNVMFIKFYWQLSMVIYIIIAFAFLLYNSRATRAREMEEFMGRVEGGKDGNGSDESADKGNKSNDGKDKSSRNGK
jgi:membrane protein implicated in regulation of membrane protease activity